MSGRRCVFIAAAALVAVAGCKAAPHGPVAQYAKITLGMPLKEAQAQMGSDGEESAYGSLPSFPKPRDVYTRLPQSAQWRVWSAVGKPTLVLGMVDGKVVYKEVEWTEDGERKADASALPEYQ